MQKIKIFILGIICLAALPAAEYTVGFYSDFEPISYAESRDEKSPDFNKPCG